MKIFKKIILKSIKLYQKIFSPDQGTLSFVVQRKICRFYPSCSEYCFRAIEKYGILKGGWKGLKRISKCHPWHPGGIDLP